MFEAYARLLVRPTVARAIVALTTLVLAVSAGLALEVRQDDDVLAFLPDANLDIATFRRINERFGSTDVALVGIPAADPFDPRFLERLGALTRELRDTEGLDSVLTLTNVADFRDDPETGGIITDDLVSALPETEAEKQALRARVMSRDHIVGTLISERADAVLVYAFGMPGAQPRVLAGRVREAVQRHFPRVEVYEGGAPFISTYIFDTTQADMARLTPWAVIAIVLIMVAAFRDLLGSALGLLATVVGITVSRAAMAVTGTSVNIVLSSMPIILFAVGSAYAIHILSHVDRHARHVGAGPEAVVRTLVGTGPTVMAAGLTTVVGLGSFVAMDIVPMQTFGLFTALGILVALITSLTFVPAVLSLWPRPVKDELGTIVMEPMQRLVAMVLRHRASMGVFVGGFAVAGLSLAGQVDTRMDLRAFFHEDSPPDRAQAFLEDRFGGSTFVQLSVQGDLDDPAVLREIARLGDRIAILPDVSDVTGIADVIGLVGEAMADARRVPDTRGQLGLLYRFAASDPSVGRLVTDTRDEALLQIKLATDDATAVDRALAAIRALVRSDAPAAYTVAPAADAPARLRDTVAARVLALLHRFDVPPRDGLADAARALLDAPAPAADPARVIARLADYLGSQESFVPLDPGPAQAVAQAVAALGPDADPDAIAAAITAALGPDGADLAFDVALALDVPRAEAWRAARAHARAATVLPGLRVVGPTGDAGDRLLARLAAAMQDLDAPTVVVPADTPDATALTWTVSGMPVLYQGLSASVTANQFRSLGLALGLVFLIMTGLYRSVSTGLLATAPTALTLAAVYGGMGWMGVHLDIGTSMLASIILGAGVDYAVHLLAAWQGDTAAEAARAAVDETAHAIWTNAIMVAAGFFVLTLGDARPLQNVGGLTAAAMIAAAFATFLVIPLLARRTRYARATLS